MKYRTLLMSLSLLVFGLFCLSLVVGRDPLPIWQAANEVFTDHSSVFAIILTEIRLPRTLIALLAGATLGLGGAAMQGLLRNPLASPDLIGSSSGAALCAVIVLYFGWQNVSLQMLPLSAMLGSLVATALVFALAGRDASITTLILAGVAVNALATSAMSLLLNLAPSPYAMRELVLWTMGDITDRSMDDFWLMLPFTLIGWALMLGVGKQLNALTLGEETAASLGVNPSWIRWRIFIAIAFAVGATVATTGMIGFIGLVVPHLLRPLVNYEPGRLLPAAALGGAAMLLAADIGVRLIPTDAAIKVGVLTALVGAPFFLYLILRNRKEHL
ncbi:iron ABC transporter permease [uncultured Thiothrix sp.]|uniref:FecCD family ABC transporter permease n=1 Tax=uncultured Thiothrix sp. TaxID=223185 RepID=UPI00263747A5|nr:iron ABC transporter permease [uncultured Thiothrix sp.]HMT92218.1 iron ABC transporter permease [Thiolinea sp.]